MASYPDYTESIAKLEGVGAASLGTIGNAIQAAPEAIGAAGAAMEGIGKNLDQARFEALKAQGITTLIQAATEKGFKPEQIAVLKTVWNQPDGQNKAYLIFQETEKQNKKQSNYDYQKSWLTSKHGSESEANAALADAQATGQPIVPPAVGEQDAQATPPPAVTTTPPAVGETVAPPSASIVSPEMEKALRVNYKNITDPKLKVKFEKRHPEVNFKTEQGTLPAPIVEATTPVIKTSMPVNEKDANLQHTRLVAGLQKYGLTQDDLKTMEPVKKLLFMRIINPEEKPDELYKIQKEILNDPRLVEGLADPESPIAMYFKNFPKDPGTESIAKDITALAALTKAEYDARANDDKKRSSAFKELRIAGEKNPGFKSFTDNAYKSVDRFGLYGPIDPKKFSAKGLAGLIASMFPSGTQAAADLLKSVGATDTADLLRKAVGDTKIFKETVIQGILAATGKASSEPERRYIESSMGFVNWGDPMSVKEGLEKYYDNRYGDYQTVLAPPVQNALEAGIGYSDIPGYANPFNTLSPKEYAKQKYGYGSTEQSAIPPTTPSAPKVNATQPGAAMPNTAPGKAVAPMYKAPAGNTRSNTMTGNKNLTTEQKRQKLIQIQQALKG